MARYRTSGRLDDQVLQDGDRGFRGIDSYQEATSLEPGFVQTSENMRLIGDLAEVRKGIDFLQVVSHLLTTDQMSVYLPALYSATQQQAQSL